MTTQEIQDLITQEAVSQGVDPALALAQAQAESNFNPNAVSSAGAIGVFQLMPATAAGLGVDPHDVAQNIQGGVSYLAQMLQKFGGDVTLALAAYNAGPGNVQKYGGVPPFPETQSYISRILSYLPLFGASPPSQNPRTGPGSISPASDPPSDPAD
jgi:soluble lytic murein transglycosylase-like protein